MTPYALMLQACGLSIREAAAFHGVREDTVKSWSSGRARDGHPDGPLRELRALHDRIAAAAEAALALIEGRPDAAEIEIGYPADDHEAQAIGFPCVGAWRAMAAMAVAGLDRPVRLVPRGATLATAAAADVHDRGRGAE